MQQIIFSCISQQNIFRQENAQLNSRTTIFCGMRNFEPNLSVSVKFLSFRGMLQNSVLASDKGTTTAYLGRVQVAVENYSICMIVPWNT